MVEALPRTPWPGASSPAGHMPADPRHPAAGSADSTVNGGASRRPSGMETGGGSAGWSGNGGRSPPPSGKEKEAPAARRKAMATTRGLAAAAMAAGGGRGVRRNAGGGRRGWERRGRGYEILGACCPVQRLLWGCLVDNPKRPVKIWLCQSWGYAKTGTKKNVFGSWPRRSLAMPKLNEE